MEIRIGDVVRLRKKHPCGSYQWQVVRVGADIGIRCQGCGHGVLLERRVFERSVKALVSPGSNLDFLAKTVLCAEPTRHRTVRMQLPPGS